MNLGFFSFFIIVSLLLWIEFYAYQATKTLLKNINVNKATWIKRIYLFQALTIISLVVYARFIQTGTVAFSFLLTVIFMSYTAKLIGVVFVFIDDIRRVLTLFFEGRKKRQARREAQGKKISRSEFLARAAVVTATLPIVTMSFGIVSGAYDYRVRRRKLYLPNLPSGFNGIKIAQLSDIHSGSFFDKKAVNGGIDLLLNEKPDVIFFTGDLVNNQTKEVNEYFDIFSRIKADMGVYSTLGNHDYGDYKQWSSPQAKQQNLQDMMEVHKRLGWNLMMNENINLKVGSDQISLIGVENWGAGRFAKYGDLEKAHLNSEGDVKILLSHDPSHWDNQVRPNFKDIDLMFAGHTHGMQLGIEIGDFRWSPSKWIYPQWADLYTQGNHHLYVNRGFGFLGFPGRIGILPEITIFELTNKPALVV
ncbi:MAG: putative MPP superfamily phosphohydrolase [Candidatus Endobugula sp.]|jgi:predicted MPP superfamily phosphohydrolase